MEQIPRMQFEYSTLVADNNYPDFEVHVAKSQQVRQTGLYCFFVFFSMLYTESFAFTPLLVWCCILLDVLFTLFVLVLVKLVS